MHLFLQELKLHHFSVMSDFFSKFGKLFHGSETPKSEPSLVGFEGTPEYKIPMSTYRVSYEFMPIKKLESLDVIQKISEELNCPSTVVRDDLKRTTSGMIPKLMVCLEYPYVDEYYRDTYYAYFARKHYNYNRFCFRLSFFSKEVNSGNFYSKENIQECFYGYVVLRPTPKRIIGYTFLSPLVYKQNDYVTCICKKSVSIKGRILDIYGFPFCGQDGEMNTCSENAISMIFDYYSRRYNKYPRVLPSQVANSITDTVIDRKQPSKGLDIDSIAEVMNINGVNTRQYFKTDVPEELAFSNRYNSTDFARLLHIYVESGFPIYAATESHAFIIHGRKNRVFANSPALITMNDQKRPYYALTKESDIVAFVVPMSENILLEAEDVRPSVIIESLKADYPDANIQIAADCYWRIYITTSRSFKSHIVNSNLSVQSTDYIVNTAMPRFIWVCEMIKNEDIKKSIDFIDVQNLIVLDSTDESDNYSNLLLFKNSHSILVPADDKTHMQRKQYFRYDSTEILHPFRNNLKGEYNNWKC